MPVASVWVLSGLVIARAPTGTTALDADTGETVWSTRAGSHSPPSWDMVTDGRRVMTVERDGGQATLVARELATGDIAWSTPSPVVGGLVQLPDGQVLVVGVTEVAALRS